MPHYTTYDCHGSTYLSVRPVDELTGTFNALNETTNFKPTQGDEIGIVHPDFKPDPRGYDPGPVGSPVKLKSLDVGPVNKTADKGWWTVDGADFRDSEIDALNEATNSDDRGYSPISGEGVFKPQDIDAKGSVIVDDKHFMPDRGSDSLTENGGVNQVCRNDLEGQAFLREQFGYDFDCEFEPAAGMNSFGESLNPVAELGGTAGPGATSFLTEQFEMPTNNIGDSACPGGDI